MSLNFNFMITIVSNRNRDLLFCQEMLYLIAQELDILFVDLSNGSDSER